MGAFADANTAVRALWSAHWPHGSTYPVFWHENGIDQPPDIATYTAWVHLRIGYNSDRIQAYGGGLRANERLLRGHVGIVVYARQEGGDTVALPLLDTAVDVFRSRRTGALSMIGEIANPLPIASADGNWWGRSAMCAFTWRFTG